MADQDVKVENCCCEGCRKYRVDAAAPATGNEFSLANIRKDFEFQPIVNPKGPVKVSLDSLDRLFDINLPEAQQKRNMEQILEMMTYLDPKYESEFQNLKFFMSVCGFLLDYDLETAATDKRLAADFLYKISRYWVMTWHALTVEESFVQAEKILRQLQKFLTQLVTYPIFAEQVVLVFFSGDKWPKVGPIQVLEAMCESSLVCLENLSFLVNLTRIDNFTESLARDTKCLEIIKDRFRESRVHVETYDEFGQLIMLLYTNLSRIEDFSNFLITGNNGYFLNVVLVDLISKPESCVPPLNVVWPFLRNLSLLEKGRNMIMDNLELHLGHILYPIAGPENLDDGANLPLELVGLHDSKTRVEDKSIRGCIIDILFSLCRYKKDRIKLRAADVYEILKHYHLAEDDTTLQERIEDLVNIIIRKEDSEIEVDDLVAGLSLNSIPDGDSTSQVSLAPGSES